MNTNVLATDMFVAGTEQKAKPAHNMNKKTCIHIPVPILAFKNRDARRILYVIIFLFLVPHFSISQSEKKIAAPDLVFEIFDMPGGDLGNHVQAIAQDSFGFMWFASQKGLHRWDGHQLKTYLNDPTDSTSIGFNYIEHILVAQDGSLWLSTFGKGIDHYDHTTETFSHYVFRPSDPDSRQSQNVVELLEDNDGNIWAATHYGVYRLNVKTGKFKQFIHDPDDPHSLSFDICRTLFKDSEGTLWFGTGLFWSKTQEGGLNRFRPETEDFVRYLHDPNDPSSLSSNRVTEIYEDSKKNFWVGTTGDGLHLMDRETGKFQRLQKTGGNPLNLSSPVRNESPLWHLRFVYEDQKNKLWIGAWDGGIQYYDPETKALKNYFHDASDSQSMPENSAWCFFQSQDGTYWGSTTGPNGRLFKIKEEKYNYHSLEDENDVAYSFCETDDGKLWVGTSQNGLFFIDIKTGKKNYFDANYLKPIIPDYGNIKFSSPTSDKKQLLCNISKIIEDEKGQLWMRQYFVDGLIRLNPKSGELRIFMHDPKDGNSIGKGNVRDVFKDKAGRIWSTTAHGDLNYYDATNEHFSKFRYAETFTKNPIFGYSAVIAPSRDGKLWIAGSGVESDPMPLFLSKFDPLTKKMTSIDLHFSPTDDIVFRQMVQDIVEDRNGKVWICGETQIMNIDPTTGSRRSSSVNHFGSSYFRGMTIDDQNKVWLFGDKITLLDPDIGLGSSLDAGIEYIPPPLYKQAVYKNKRGEIYIGGQGGFLHIDPERIGTNKWPKIPKLIITDFQLLEEADNGFAKKKNVINVLGLDELSLTYKQNAFSFRFAALSFQNPKSTRYEFKLEGYDKQWRPTGLEPICTYVKVPPGDYIFRVRAASGSGEWEVEKSLHICISPPWWATWWAYTVYALLFFGILYTINRYQLTRKLDKAEAHRLKELDTFKTRFYANITHEFRTPLTVISGMADALKNNPEQEREKKLDLIKKNSQSLLALVNQMLDLSKLQAGKMPSLTWQGDMLVFLKYLIEAHESFAKTKNVGLQFYSEEKELPMDFDTNKMEQVLNNLISNAIKFTPAYGKILVVAKRHISNSKPWLEIKIKDTGIGISEEQLPHIFDRFHQANPTHENQGSGIGLALVKELMDNMDGKIRVDSSLHAGTTFTLQLPITNHAPFSETKPVKEPAAPPVLSPEMVDGTELLDDGLPILLIIEDSPDVTYYLKSTLENDYQIVAARNGRRGVEKALDILPDIIISDVMMPEMDGFEVCQKLKTDERTNHIPVILLTAKATTDDKLAGLSHGADAYLVKPFEKAELMVRLEKLMELRRTLQKKYSTALVGGQIENTKAPAPEEIFLQKLEVIVLAHHENEDFSIHELSRELLLSRSQVHRKIKALTGLSTAIYIRHVRLEKAKELLRTTHLSISEIAYQTGFKTPVYFSQIFKEVVGASPTEWRGKG